jgi:hypothetical protein
LKSGAIVSRVGFPGELVAFESVLVRRIRPCLGLTPVPVGGPLPRLSTKLGGVPDLPPGTPWPVDPDEGPLPFVFQLNLTGLAERFVGLLPWPAGGGLVQLFSNGDDTGVRVLVHRDLGALRPAEPPATPPVERYAQYRLDPVLTESLVDRGPDAEPPMWSLYRQLSKEHGDLLQNWFFEFGASIQVGGGVPWHQHPGYWQGWAQDRGLYPFPSNGVDDPDGRRLYDNAEEQAQAEDWQLVCMLSDAPRVPEEFASGGGFYFMAPPDATGRWDIDRLQMVYQCT